MTVYVRLAIAFFFLLVTGSLVVRSSQPERKAPSFAGKSAGAAYSFIRGEENVLHFPGDTKKWDRLFHKMDELAFEGTGKLSVLHIGGSHVQGGWLSDRLRWYFNQLNGGVQGERGFLFPYKMAGTNSPGTIECSWTGRWEGCRNSLSNHNCDWGVSGITATTSDQGASVSIAAQSYDSSYYAFDRIIIYHTGTENACIVPDSSAYVRRISENKEAGYTEFSLNRMVNQFRFSVEFTDEIPGYFSFQGAYLGNNHPGVSYHAIGVNGASTHSYLRCTRFESQLKTIHPDLVVFAVGVNDANVPEQEFNREAYEARCDSMVRQFQRVNPRVCFLFVTNNDTYYNRRYPNRNGATVRQAMMNLASRHDGAVYDLFGVMGGLGSIDSWVSSGLAAKDRVHFTRRGYELQADLMFEAISKAFGDYLAEKGS